MKRTVVAIAVSLMSLSAQAAEIDLAYGADRSRWTLDTSTPLVRQDGYVGAWVVSYTPRGRFPAAAVVAGCEQGYGTVYMKWASSDATQSSNEMYWYWTRAGDRLFDILAMGICTARGVSQ